MSIPPESIEVGQCYLTDTGRVRRVIGLPQGRVQFQQRMGHNSWRSFTSDILDIRSFAFTVERPVSCDWILERDESEARHTPSKR